MKTLELEVLRKYLHQTYTIGRLTIDGEKFSDTLEDVVRELIDSNGDGQFENKVYGETAIPSGRYQVIVNYSPKLKRRLPRLLNVPGFEGILIHSLVSAKGTEGCIGIGENKQQGRLTNGLYYETRLVQILDEAINNGSKAYITIKQNS
jgi:hypothetical protein